MAMRTSVELDEDGILLVSKFEEFCSRYLIHVLAIFFYLSLLTLGLHQDDFLIQSPLVKFTSFIMGFCASVISWILAFLIMGIVFGKFDFAREVFNLYSSNDFSIAIALIFLVMPIAIFFSRIINRTVSSHLWRGRMFYVSFIFMIASLVSAIEYTIPFENQYAYIFSCSVVGMIYFAIFVINAEVRRTRMRQRQQRQSNFL